MTKKSIMFYSISLLVALIVIFAPIGIKFLHSGLSFRGFLASLEYGIDVATTIGFVGAIFVFWVTKHKEHLEEQRLAAARKAEEDERAQARRDKELEDQRRMRDAQLLDNSRASTITFLQQTNDDISEFLVQFDKKFFYKFRSLRKDLLSEMDLLDYECEAAFIDYETQVASDDDTYALDYKKMAPKFTENLRLMQNEFSEWSSGTEKTVRGRFFNLLPILRTQSVLGSKEKSKEKNSSTERNELKDFNSLLNRAHTARKNIVSLRSSFEDDDGGKQYHANILQDVTAFGEEFVELLSDENIEQFAHTMKTEGFNKIDAVGQKTEEIDFKEFDNLLNSVHTARKNIVSVLSIFEQVNSYPSHKLRNNLYGVEENDGSRWYFEDLLRDVTEFGEEFTELLSDDNMDQFAHTMKTEGSFKIHFVGHKTEEIVCKIVKPAFSGRDTTFKVIDRCVDTYVDCLEDVAIYCAALQEAILTRNPKKFGEAKLEYRKIMEQSNGNTQSKFQAVMKNDLDKGRFWGRRQNRSEVIK